VRTKLEPLLCELHSHTTWSDGALSVRRLVDLYGSRGFDVLCITDHTQRSVGDPGVPAGEPPGGIRSDNHAAYLTAVLGEAERALRLYGLLLLPGLELTYGDMDPLVSAHALALGIERFVGVDGGIDAAMREARAAGAAIVAAHPYPVDPGSVTGRGTQRFADRWRELEGVVDRYELFNRTELFAWVAEAGLPSVATGDFHRLEHLAGWKTLVPCAKDVEAVVRYLRSPRPVYLARLTPEADARLAA